MATEFPNSYKDNTYASLDAATEQKLGLPSGLLASVRTNGERSNHDQSNAETKTATVYQFVPATRKAILDKYGIDVTLNPQNASEGAGLLLKEGLERNKGDAAAAVGEYAGGLDRSKWGPITKNYIARVTGGIPAAAPSAAPSQSTFDRVSAQMDQQDKASPMATVLQAYQSGQMSPEDAKTFEGEVKAGRVMLPRGVSLNAAPGQPAGASTSGPQALPAAVSAAYLGGRMTPEDRAQVDALVKQGIVADPLKGAAAIPGQTEGAPSDVSKAVPDPTIGERIVGTGEAALNLATGATGGAVGAIKGTVAGMFDPNVTNMQQLSDAATKGAEALTYAPRTESGQSQAAFAGNVLSNAVPLAGMTGELASAGAAANALKPTAQAIPQVARNTAATAAQAVAEGAGKVVPDVIKALPEKVGEMMGREPAQTRPTPGTMGSVGAAGTDLAAQRRATAESLGVRLTEGEAGRQHPQMQFEGETAKMPNAAGEMLRQRSAENNATVIRRFENWIDDTGRAAVDTTGVGKSITGALEKGLENRKNEYRVKYAAAEKAGETAVPVDTTPIADALNAASSAEGSAPILGAAKRELIRLGGGALDENGNVVGGQMRINDVEALRKFIGKTTKEADGTDVFYSGQLRDGIDAVMDGAPGDLFKEARASFRRTQELYKDNALIKDLISQKKGTTDRKVALENVVRRTVIGGSREDLGKLRRTLLVDGSEEGKQAWKDIQGATLQYLADEANANPVSPKSAVTDIHGNPVVSAAGLNKAVKSLDKGEKLDFLLGKQGAQKVRDINEVVGLIKTFPPGTVNTSNTASILITALTEAGGTAALTGLPIPVLSALKAASQHIKDRRLRMRVAEALGDARRKEAAAPRPIKTKKTIH